MSTARKAEGGDDRLVDQGPDARPGTIALFVPRLSGGGAERVMLNLAHEFVEQGRPVDLVLGEEVGPLVSEVNAKVHVTSLGAADAVRAVPRLVGYLKERGPAVLMSTLRNANLAAIIASRMVGKSVCIVVREANTLTAELRLRGSLKHHVYRFAMRKLYPYADAVVANSHGSASALAKVLGRAPESVHVVPNALRLQSVRMGAVADVDHPWLRDKTYPVILSVGRLEWQKGYDDLLRAFAMVRSSVPAKLIILGEGKQRSELLALAQALDIGKDVSLPGFVANPYGYMARADVFVLASRWEGSPNVLIEALACGSSVVATDCESGPREILENGLHGALVPVGAVREMASATLAALQSGVSPHRQRWRPEAYAASAVAGMYLTLFDACIAKKLLWHQPESVIR